MNALSALAACRAVGVDVAAVIPALARFRSVKRRLELLGDARGVTVYDDFAHHPTAIATTLAGLRAKVGGARIVVAMEPRSNSMRLGAHADALEPDRQRVGEGKGESVRVDTGGRCIIKNKKRK